MLIHNIGSIANKLKYDFDSLSSILNHSGTKGDLRENALKQGLRDLIPQKYEIGKGIVIDANGIQSKQQDFMFYDAFSSPSFLKDESTVVLPVESVCAITEVKSTLNQVELDKAIENAISVKSLSKSLLYPPGFPEIPSNFIYSSVFAYTSNMDLETLRKRFDEANQKHNIPFEHRISTICILDKGCIVTANGIETYNTQPSESTVTVCRPLSIKLALYMYYLILQFHLSSNVAYPPDLLHYTKKSEALKSTRIIIDFDSLRKLGGTTIGNMFLSSEDVDRYKRLMPYIDRVATDEELKEIGLTRDELCRELIWAKNWRTQLNAASEERDGLSHKDSYNE